VVQAMTAQVTTAASPMLSQIASEVRSNSFMCAR
jgi:hypothetical protein